MIRVPLPLTLLIVASHACAQAATAATPPAWQHPNVLVAAIGVPGALLSIWVAHLFRMRQLALRSTVQRDDADLIAIQSREKAVNDLLNLLTTQATQRDALIAENAAQKTRLDQVEIRQKEREDRERSLIADLATLRAEHEHLRERQHHLDSCSGGQPCPLSHLRRASV